MLAVAAAVVLLAGCGGSSSVSPGAYVKSICTALVGWRDQIQSAGRTLQASGLNTASPATAKRQYLTFVSTLLSATRQATASLKSAGTPSVSNGTQIAGGLEQAFARGSGLLATANTHAQAISTASVSAFETAASAVTDEIKSALQGIATITPRSSPPLRAAAVREPACRALAA